MSEEYTPTEDELRRIYALKVPQGQRDRRYAEFDRLIEKIELRGGIEALESLGHELIDGKDPETDTRIFDPWDVAEILFMFAGTLRSPQLIKQRGKTT